MQKNYHYIMNMTRNIKTSRTGQQYFIGLWKISQAFIVPDKPLNQSKHI